jgi:hypothetical protein
MVGDQLLSDDESGRRGTVRRLASPLLIFVVVAGIAAGGMAIFQWLEHRRAVEKRLAAVKRWKMLAESWSPRTDETPW